MAYLTADQIIDRLEDRFGLTAEVLDGDAAIASADLDKLPFVGVKTDSTQAHEFPRYPETEVPDAILDWVALRAYQLSVDDEAAVQSESAGKVSVSYFRAKRSQTERRMEALVGPYRSGAAVRIV
jgi:hypothetical protein